jgi:Predicted membrane protein (DUF2207)
MRSRSIMSGLLFFLVLSLSILSTTAIQATAAYPFYWETMNVDLQLIDSGDLLVTETQKYIFTDPYTNQRSRYIKIDNIDKIQDIQVTENEHPVSNLQVSIADGKQHIQWEHSLSTKFPEIHTFVLKYRVIGGLEVAATQTKFKWMAIFPDRQASIKSAKVSLYLPANLSQFAKNFTANGVGTTTKNIDPTTIQFTSAGSIEPQSMLAILGEFSNDALNLKKSQWQSPSNHINLWFFIVSCLILLILLLEKFEIFDKIFNDNNDLIFGTSLFLAILCWWCLLCIVNSTLGALLFWIVVIMGQSSQNCSYGGCDGGGDGGGCGGCGGCGGGD